MPLPESAGEFLDLAFEHTEYNGVIHYYRFLEDENWQPLLDEVESAAEETEKEYEIIGKTVCGQRAPNIDRVCVDIEIK